MLTFDNIIYIHLAYLYPAELKQYQSLTKEEALKELIKTNNFMYANYFIKNISFENENKDILHMIVENKSHIFTKFLLEKHHYLFYVLYDFLTMKPTLKTSLAVKQYLYGYHQVNTIIFKKSLLSLFDSYIISDIKNIIEQYIIFTDFAEYYIINQKNIPKKKSCNLL
jgi:hypothetical protein